MKNLLAAASIAALASVSLAPAAQAADEGGLAGDVVTIGGTKIPVVAAAVAAVVVIGGVALVASGDDDDDSPVVTAD